ncbi:transcriptional regulator [Salinibacterium sp. CAN_S4]|uniref:transcriptional regulator n=1 Tax=Salinibacterium sp. CAN_S4 TaxID=2787727 RepID=UPI0018EFEEEA
MVEGRFDPLIHAPQRLRICAMLSRADGIEFGEIQRRTGLSKSALSKHLTQLIDADLLADEQFLRAGSARLMLSLTDHGRKAYEAHRKALEELLAAEDNISALTEPRHAP